MKKTLTFIIITVAVCILLFLFLENGNKDSLGVSDLNLVEDNMDFAELKIETLIEGEGKESKNGDKLVVNYVGTLKDGTQFDSSYSRNESFEFTLGEGRVITGWEEGMLGMKIGEKRRLEIPSTYGYGESGAGELIPASSGLIFEVELLEIK